MLQGHGLGTLPNPHRGWQGGAEAHGRRHPGANRAGAQWGDNRPQLTAESSGHAVGSAGRKKKIINTIYDADETNMSLFVIFPFLFRFTGSPLKKDSLLRPTACMQQRDSGWCRREMWVRLSSVWEILLAQMNPLDQWAILNANLLFCFMNTEGYIRLSKMLLVCVSVLRRPQILTAMDLHPWLIVRLF